jgi:diguanylate cyclase (GGDEF)-like protein
LTQTSIEQKVLRSFLLAIACAIAIGAASLWLQMKFTTAQVNMDYDQSVLHAVDQVLQSEVNVETGQRGYLITGNASYLVPYEAGRAAVHGNLALLESLLPKTPESRASMARLQSLSALKLAEMAETIRLEKDSGFGAAKALVDTDTGRNALDQIRAILANWSTIYSGKVVQERHQLSIVAWRTHGSLLLSGLTMSGLLIWAYWRIFRDLRQRRILATRLAHEASHDPLTQLPNRRLFGEWTQYALSQAEREGQQAAIFYLDIDGFKGVNDRFGHAQGDLLLQAVAARLRDATRGGDVVARLGGDEFAVLLPTLSNFGDPAGLAQRLLEALSNPFPETSGLSVGVTIGIAVFPTDASTPERLISAADTAMYNAKRAGGRRYAFCSEVQNGLQERDLQLRADLFHCAGRGQLQVLYQPVVDLHGEIRSLEALVRWNHPELGQISPEEFIPLAERSGAILQIDRFVRQTVIKQAAQWLEAGLPLAIAVNTSAMEFAVESLLPSVLDDLEAHKLPTKYLTIELTETSLLKTESAATLHRLSGAGLSMVLDDFGTGYSSLSHLFHFPISGLKIDRLFVDKLPGHEESRRLVSAVLQMGASLNLSMVAEGVETAEQAEWLVTQGCTLMQGYFFGRPMDAAAMETRLRTCQSPVVQN